MTPRSLTLLVAMSSVLALGCNDGPEVVPVAGQVLIDGKPLPYGTVMFINTGSRPGAASSIAKAAFNFPASNRVTEPLSANTWSA